MVMKYNTGGATSTIDGAGASQMHDFFWMRKSIVESRKDQYFMPMADVTNMPKNMGKTIKVHQYIPLLDDRNINDQGIDANGAVISVLDFFITFNDLTITGLTPQAAADAIVTAVNNIEAAVAVRSGAGPYTVTFSKDSLVAATEAEKNALLALVPSIKVVQGSGNLYGSSKDTGYITGKLPVLTENGGRVNRVGFTRLEREGQLFKFGMFTEFTKESLDFDSDPELWGHISRELVSGAVQITEAVLQKDLLASAGVVHYAGAALTNSQMTAEGGTPSIVDYDDLGRLSIILDENRTPKQTKIIDGSRMIDTRTIDAGRVMFIGSELQPLLKRMEDSFQEPAFIPVHKYGNAGTLMNGEIGTIDQFRMIVVPEMQHWSGAGAAVGVNPGYRATGDNYDIFPMLVIGDSSFTTIGFQTDGKTVKFDIITKKPGRETADRTDPYGELGFSSIKWYYGMLVLRPERIALLKTLAPV